MDIRIHAYITIARNHEEVVEWLKNGSPDTVIARS